MDGLIAFLEPTYLKILAKLADEWVLLSIVGQAMFTSRFVVQWLHSERRRKSVIPVAFWYLSLAGGSTLLIYTIHINEYVLALGQAAGLVPYTRNLMLIWRERRADAPAVADK